MAVTCTITRNSHTETASTTEEFATAVLSGTYSTGFTTNPFTVSGGPGSSPMDGKILREMRWCSPKGYTYFSNLVTGATQIFNGTTELVAGAVLPDMALSVVLVKSKV